MPDFLTNFDDNTYAAILDDHQLYAEPFASFLEKTGVFKNVLCFTEESAFIRFLMNQTSKTPIYAFIDFYLKDKTTLHLYNDLKRLYKPLYIIIVSSVTNPILINEILQYKIDGFLSKYSGTEELGIALKYIKSKNQYISPSIINLLSTYNSTNKISFSPRETEILEVLAKGYKVEDAAKILHLSKHTIVTHKRSMMTKTNSKTLTELLAYARKNELI